MGKALSMNISQAREIFDKANDFKERHPDLIFNGTEERA